MSEVVQPYAKRANDTRTCLIQDAKTLFESHKDLLRRKAIIIARLRAEPSDPDRRIGEKIEEMVLGGQQLDGMPKARRRESSTERVAMKFRELLQDEVNQENVARLKELRMIELNLDIYDAIIRSLNDTEATIIRLYYDEGIPFSQMAKSAGLTAELQVYSASTLKRLNQKILDKINGVLKEPK